MSNAGHQLVLNHVKIHYQFSQQHPFLCIAQISTGDGDPLLCIAQIFTGDEDMYG
jgi:hypothetical protein